MQREFSILCMRRKWAKSARHRGKQASALLFHALPVVLRVCAFPWFVRHVCVHTHTPLHMHTKHRTHTRIYIYMFLFKDYVLTHFSVKICDTRCIFLNKYVCKEMCMYIHAYKCTHMHKSALQIWRPISSPQQTLPGLLACKASQYAGSKQRCHALINTHTNTHTYVWTKRTIVCMNARVRMLHTQNAPYHHHDVPHQACLQRQGTLAAALSPPLIQCGLQLHDAAAASRSAQEATKCTSARYTAR